MGPLPDTLPSWVESCWVLRRFLFLSFVSETRQLVRIFLHLLRDGNMGHHLTSASEYRI